ncbi:hypothetical protein VKT23_008570 [Stygiomarasmius scandens]|uniref:Uncharacterized protein n=1 Tax=Marasmiellus scandens TaxID=2682957 RepID=A0ABR1JHN8_9AGAR
MYFGFSNHPRHRRKVFPRYSHPATPSSLPVHCGMSESVSFNDHLVVRTTDLASGPYSRSPNVNSELESSCPNAVSDQNQSRNAIKYGYTKGLRLKELQQSLEMCKRIMGTFSDPPVEIEFMTYVEGLLTAVNWELASSHYHMTDATTVQPLSV